MVTPFGVLNIAFGLVGQICTHGASEQWLHKTGIALNLETGNFPSVIVIKSAQLNEFLPLLFLVLFSVLQPNAHAPQAVHFCKSITIATCAIS
jgi:hypothetical protein